MSFGVLLRNGETCAVEYFFLNEVLVNLFSHLVVQCVFYELYVSDSLVPL